MTMVSISERFSHFRELAFSVATVAFGRAFGQLIVFAATLFAARYFSPDDFGSVGLFSSAIALGSSAVSLRLEARAQVSRLLRNKNSFFGMAYAANIVVAACLYISIIVFAVFSERSPGGALLLLPVAITATSLSLYIIPAQNADPPNPKLVGLMAQVSAAVVAAVQIGAALFHPHAMMLILARTAGPVAACAVGWSSVRRGFDYASNLSKKSSKKLLYTSGREIFYGLPSSILTTVALQIPVYLYNYFGMKAEAGVFWLAFNLLFVPYIVVSSSLRPIYLAKLMTIKVGQRPLYVLKSTIIALAIGAGALAVIDVGSILLTNSFLNEEWSSASKYILWLSPMVLGLIAVTPITIAVSVNRQQGLNFAYTVAQVVVRFVATAGMLLAGYGGVPAIAAFSICSASISVVYAIVSLAPTMNSRPARFLL